MRDLATIMLLSFYLHLAELIYGYYWKMRIVGACVREYNIH